jgi:hypothetical protein
MKTMVNTLGAHTRGYTSTTDLTTTTLASSYGYYANSASRAKAQHLGAITNSLGATTLASHSYDYDLAGRMTAWGKTKRPHRSQRATCQQQHLRLQPQR